MVRTVPITLHGSHIEAIHFTLVHPHTIYLHAYPTAPHTLTTPTTAELGVTTTDDGGW